MTIPEELLNRYRAAAESISDVTTEELLGLDPATQDGCDIDVAAKMEDLLKQEAKNLIQLHQNDPGDRDSDLSARRLEDLATTSMPKLYAYRHDKVPHYWRQIYCDALILATYCQILSSRTSGTWLAEVDGIVDKLDRAVIIAGGTNKVLGAGWIEKTLQLMEDAWKSSENECRRPTKRVKLDTGSDTGSFSTSEPFGRPNLSRPCPRQSGWSILQFEEYMNNTRSEPKPMVFTDLMREWPALRDSLWCKPNYLLSKTFGGKRLVPVEIGRSYVDDGWGQELIPFKQYLQRYIDPTVDNKGTQPDSEREIGYLAQHNLFRQLPSLRNDIQVPDLCWADVPGHPTDSSKNQAPLDVPQLNAWFGPAQTITPLHVDGYHNLLCQVVGAKYVRLYPPSVTKHMSPRAPENGVDMSNTSELDVGVIEGWDKPAPDLDCETLSTLRESLRDVEYKECILEPGDTLLIPIGWWHYVRSLSISFSVSFWWN